MIVLIVIQCIVCYFIGNINPAILLGKAYGIDIRKEGSGNAGTTNVMRTIGKKAGIITFVIDVLKGYLSCVLMLILFRIIDYKIFIGIVLPSDIIVFFTHSRSFADLTFMYGLFVIVGHMWPIIYKFKGGKGVATTFGVFLAFDWLFALILLAIVLICTLITKRVSLAVIIACICIFPINYLLDHLYSLTGYYYNTIMIKYPTTLAVIIILIIIKHIPNIKRLIRGQEPKMSFGSKDKQKTDNV